MKDELKELNKSLIIFGTILSLELLGLICFIVNTLLKFMLI